VLIAMANPDLNQLLSSLLPFAERMLAKRGEFFPFAMAMKPNGEIETISVYEGDEHPAPETLIELTTQAFKQQAREGQIRAAGICYDVRTVPPGRSEKCDAVCTSLEHHTGESVDVYLPYEKDSRGNIQYGEMFATRRTPQFFVPEKSL
jgi:hypothetical protein